MKGLELRELVRRRRQNLGWSQSDLARAMGTSPSRVAKVETGDASTSVELVARALETMGMRVLVTAREDVFRGLTKAEMRMAATRFLRIRVAKQLARKHDVDPGDVEQALFRLSISPVERLQRSMRRAQLRRLAA
jgi:transcriptional regulator with XRE-family HTH domain